MIIRTATTIKQRIVRFLLQSLHMQLFVTLISLPILISWGLPLSATSMLSNIMFSPFLTLFLFLASLIFFTELLSIPNMYLITLLDYCTTWWSWFLEKAQDCWLIEIPTANVCLYAFIIGATFFTLQRTFLTIKQRILAYSLILISFIIVARWNTEPFFIKRITYVNQKSLTIIHTQHKTIVIDRGIFNTIQSLESWLEYTLVPHLIQNTGKSTIDFLITLHPNGFTPKTLLTFMEKCSINYLIMPYCSATKPSLKYGLSQLKRTLYKKQINHILIKNQSITLPITSTCVLTVQPQQIITTPAQSFNVLSTHLFLHEETYSFYSQKALVDNTTTKN